MGNLTVPNRAPWKHPETPGSKRSPPRATWACKHLWFIGHGKQDANWNHDDSWRLHRTSKNHHVMLHRHLRKQFNIFQIPAMWLHHIVWGDTPRLSARMFPKMGDLINVVNRPNNQPHLNLKPHIVEKTSPASFWCRGRSNAWNKYQLHVLPVVQCAAATCPEAWRRPVRSHS